MSGDSNLTNSCCDHDTNLKRSGILISIALVLCIVGLIYRAELIATPYRIGDYLVFITLYLLVGWDILLASYRNILKKNPFDENFLMSIATLGAIAIQKLPEAGAVMLFFKVGEYFQMWAVNNSRRSIKALLELKSEFANLLVDGETQKVDPESVNVGQEIIVRPGEKVPLDGTIIKGRSQLDTSALTGESVPRVMKEGDTILAGMINKEGLLTIQVTKLFADSSVAKIMDLVENASHKKAKTEKFITQLAKVYTPIIVGIALGIAILPPLLISGATFYDWIYRSLILLVISCPCGLVISIPLGYFGGLGGSARKGILVKGATYLDSLTKVKTVAFDKTGTLTKGVFKVTEIVTKNGFSQDELLAAAAKTESNSNHPIALSIIQAYKKTIDQKTIESYEEVPAHGIRAVIEGVEILVGNDRFLHKEAIEHDTCHVQGTLAHVVIDRKYAGYLLISDEIKEDSLEAIRSLRKLGVKHICMLTGDSEDVGKEVAKKLELDEYLAELLPEDKVSAVEEFIEASSPKERLVFVGDGVNDAPVLTRSDIGIAMGGLGSDAAIETADVVIMSDHPSKVAVAIQMGKKTRRIILQNISFAMGIKGIFILLGILVKRPCGKLSLPMWVWLF